MYMYDVHVDRYASELNRFCPKHDPEDKHIEWHTMHDKHTKSHNVRQGRSPNIACNLISRCNYLNTHSTYQSCTQVMVDIRR